MKKRFIYPIIGLLLLWFVAGTILWGYSLFGFIAVPLILLSYTAVVIGYLAGAEADQGVDVFHAKPKDED